jgi:hypothetical protein
MDGMEFSAINELFDKLVDGVQMSYLLTYKLSQDHLEMFFGAVRRRGGCGVNPTCRLFKSSYKRLVIFNEICSSGNANAIDQFDIKILHVTKRNKKSADLYDITSHSFDDLRNTDLLVDDYQTFFSDSNPTIELMNEHGYASHTTSDLSRSAICEYLSGFVVKKLKCVVKCSACCAALIGTDDDLSNYSFLDFKNRGGLTIPSPNVVQVCKLAESLFKQNTDPKDLSKILSLDLPDQIAKATGQLNLFDDLSEHEAGLDMLSSHVTGLVKIVSKTYIDIRIFHETNLLKLADGVSTRSFDSRLIIFKHM